MKEKLKNIKLLLLDVDGVLTKGEITYSDSGEQIKSFHASDGLGLRLLMDAGVDVGIVTGRTSQALLHRCENLGLELIFDGIKDKAKALERIVDDTKIPRSQIAFMGDDLIDLPALIRCGFSATVPAAPEEVKSRVDMVTKACGGQGAVRELCQAILKARGDWEQIMAKYLQ